MRATKKTPFWPANADREAWKTPKKGDSIGLSRTDHSGDRVMEASGHEVTQLLKAWSESDVRALGNVTALVYQELHREKQSGA